MAAGNAKIILCGEHAVLGGARALVVPYMQGATAVVDDVSERWLVNDMVRPELEAPTAALFGVLGRRRGGRATLHAPAGVGLGISAALGVAIARAVAPDAAVAQHQAAAMAWEQCLHGRASGVDVAAAMASGPLLFGMGTSPESVRCTPMRAWLLPVLVESAPPTSHMVAQVQAWATQHPEEWRAFCQASGERTMHFRDALMAGDSKTVGTCMREANEALSHVGVTTAATDAMVSALVAAGAQGAKITGAGGGGVVIALVDDEQLQAVRDACNRRGGNVLAAIRIVGDSA